LERAETVAVAMVEIIHQLLQFQVPLILAVAVAVVAIPV